MELIDMSELKYYGKAFAINFKKFLDRTVEDTTTCSASIRRNRRRFSWKSARNWKKKETIKGPEKSIRKSLPLNRTMLIRFLSWARCTSNTGQFNEAREALKKVVASGQQYCAGLLSPGVRSFCAR